MSALASTDSQVSVAIYCHLTQFYCSRCITLHSKNEAHHWDWKVTHFRNECLSDSDARILTQPDHPLHTTHPLRTGKSEIDINPNPTTSDGARQQNPTVQVS